jgi:hypothetical protein
MSSGEYSNHAVFTTVTVARALSPMDNESGQDRETELAIAPHILNEARKITMKATHMKARLVTVLTLMGLGIGGCMESPTNGQTFRGSNVNRILHVSGKYDFPGATITVQVLNNPTLDPTLDANWTTLGTAASSTTGLSHNDSRLYYPWAVDLKPVASTAQLSRWPQGGLARMRAVAIRSGQPTILTTFDDDIRSCYLAHQSESWVSIGANCASPYGKPPLIVSTTPSPADAPTSPGYLTAPFGTTNTTAAYYATIAAPATLDAFRTKYGMGGADEVAAVYFNKGDLGLGRDMHCRYYIFPFVDTGVACYVTNYAPKNALGKAIFDQTASALNAAVSKDPTKVIATV